MGLAGLVDFGTLGLVLDSWIGISDGFFTGARRS